MGHDPPDALRELGLPLREAVRLALSDLQQPTPVPLEKLTFEANPEDERFGVLTVWFANGTGGGFGLLVGGDRGQLVADVADQIQELFHEEREAWGEARPPCAGSARTTGESSRPSGISSSARGAGAAADSSPS
jgi:hypothetical protein